MTTTGRRKSAYNVIGWPEQGVNVVKRRVQADLNKRLSKSRMLSFFYSFFPAIIKKNKTVSCTCRVSTKTVGRVCVIAVSQRTLNRGHLLVRIVAKIIFDETKCVSLALCVCFSMALCTYSVPILSYYNTIL